MMQHLRPNTTLQGGKYRIERVLGQGGFGITYLATQTSLNRQVAIKEFFIKDFCNDDMTLTMSVPSTGSSKVVDQYKKKFIKEARNLAKLHHQNIIRVIDVFEENGTVYYVMPFMPGGSLQDYVKKHGPLDELEALKYIKQIAGALKYMHEEEHICHYDVKPANILLDNNKNAILIDFGISKNYDESGRETTSTPIGISEGYAPIEQYQQGVAEFSPASDVYALGATLYFLLHGNHPVSSVKRASGTTLPMERTLSQRAKTVINASMKISKQERANSVDVFINETKGGRGSSVILWIIGVLFAIGIVCVIIFSLKKTTNNIEITQPTKVVPKDTTTVVNEKIEEKKSIQHKSATIAENYAGKKFNYNIQVNDGILKWTYSGEGGKDSKTINCNPDIDADIIIAEFKGLAYWGIASELLWDMVEEEKVYIWDLHNGAKDALGKCVSCLSKARSNCPNAYKKAQEMYKNLIDAENSGGDALWNEIGTMSFAMGEYPLDVCDIYN